MYNAFLNNSPIADNNGPVLVDVSEKNLQALRDIILTGAAIGWNYLNYGPFFGGTYSQPSIYGWTKGLESILVAATWGTDGPSTFVWYYSNEKVANQLIGVETFTFSGAGDCTATVWSGTIVAPVFLEGKPISATDSLLLTIDNIRKNLMALRDEAIVGLGQKWDYTMSIDGNGNPNVQAWEKGAGPERIECTVTSYFLDYPVTIQWRYRPNSGAGWQVMGIQTYGYGTDADCVSITWSGAGSYLAFENDVPIISESDANNIILDIKNNQQCLRDGCVMQTIPFWNWSVSGGVANFPLYEYFKNGTKWIRITNTYGVSGNEELCITKQVYEYSETSGSSYDLVGTQNFVYADYGIVGSTNWV